MTLSLVTAPDPIQVYPSGLIVVRCEDYLGAARGTLTTTADALSVAGTVVKDTQTIAVATGAGPVNQSTRFGLASNTVVVPWADITALYDNTDADGLWISLGLRVVGEAPATAQSSSSFYTHLSSGGSVGVGFGRGTTHRQTADVWKDVWGDQYRITAAIQWDDTSFLGTNLTVRAWGITGGTTELYLDVLYLMPYTTFSGVTNWWDFYQVNQFLPFKEAPNGTIDDGRDVDLDAVDNVLGQFSVVEFNTGFMSSAQGQSSSPNDYQEENHEPTVYNATNNLWDGSLMGLTDPASWMVFQASHLYLPAQTLIADDFPNTYLAPVPPPSLFPVISTPSMFTKYLIKGDSGAAGDNGFSELAGHMRARGTGGIDAFMQFGAGTLITGDANLLENHHPILSDLHDCIQTIAFESDHVYEIRTMLGKQTPNVELTYEGAVVRLDSGGNLDLTLENWGNAAVGPTPDQIAFAGPVNITGSYAANDRYWIKSEKRSYFWRAKCWADGDPEPDWQVEGWSYLEACDSGQANDDWVAYPYDTNWVGDANHDIVKVNPLFEYGVPTVIVKWELPSAVPMEVRYYDYLLEVDPAGSDPGYMYMQELAYDESAPSNELPVPYGSWRMVEGSKKVRHFNSDADGFNVHAWKDGNAPELQSSCVPLIYERVPVPGGVIPLFRPRVFSVSNV